MYAYKGAAAGIKPPFTKMTIFLTRPKKHRRNKENTESLILQLIDK